MEIAGRANKESALDIEKFDMVSSWQGREWYYLYQFSDSVPASKAETRHFVMSTSRVESCDILPETQHKTIRIDFHFVTLSHATAAAAMAYSTKLKSLLEDESKDSILERIEKEAQLPQLPLQLDVPQSVDIKLDEMTMNDIVFKAISGEAEKFGFRVATNTSGSHKSKSSKYYNSRPDLTMYRNNCGYIVIHTGASEESESPIAAISEKGDAVGQLLAGMDKVAGDLAFEQLRSNKAATERLFRYIIIYGLVINYEDHSCTPYKLTMDFVINSSTLDTGTQQLPLEEGVTRLLSKLEQTTV